VTEWLFRVVLAVTVAAGWLPVSLGPHVLRAETAAAAAVAILMNAWMR